MSGFIATRRNENKEIKITPEKKDVIINELIKNSKGDRFCFDLLELEKEGISYNEADIIIRDLSSNRYINCEGCLSSRTVTLNMSIFELKENGGFKNLYERIEEEEKEKLKKEKREKENLELNTKLNKWLYKTKWFPLVLSLIAIIISICTFSSKCTDGKSNNTEYKNGKNEYNNKNSAVSNKKDSTINKQQ